MTFSVPLVAHQGRPRIRKAARSAWLYEASDDEQRKRVIAAEFRKEYRGPYPMLDGPARVEVLVFAPLPKARRTASRARKRSYSPTRTTRR